MAKNELTGLIHQQATRDDQGKIDIPDEALVAIGVKIGLSYSNLPSAGKDLFKTDCIWIANGYSGTIKTNTFYERAR